MVVSVVAAPLAAQVEAPRGLVVTGLSFEGNRALSNAALRISIATSKSSFFLFGVIRFLGEKRYFDELEFRRDVLRIQALYRLSGYLEVQVDTVVRRTDRNVSVRFRITEGEPVRVASINIIGAHNAAPTPALLRRMTLKTGAAFSRFELRASADTILRILQDVGYPYVGVQYSFEQDSAQRVAHVAYQVDPGNQSRISAVAVTGTNKVDPGVVRRAVGIRSGQVFKRQDLYDTQQNLYRTDLFTYVNVGLVDSVRSGDTDSLVAIQVQVTEGQLHVIRAGVGYGSLDCFRGEAGWTGRNFFGGGRSLDLTGRLSKLGNQRAVCPALRDDPDPVRRRLNYDATITLREPFLFTRSTSGSFSVFAERHSEFRTFTRIAEGGELAVTQLLTPRLPLVVTYELARAQTLADAAGFCVYLNVCLIEDQVFSARHLESTLGASLAWTGVNSVFNPTRGFTLSAQVRYASKLIGSADQRQFTKGVFEASGYQSVGASTIAGRLRIGAVLPARLNAFVGGAQFTPPDERLYLGGSNTVRGFSQNELGPLVRVESIDTTATPRDTTFRTSPTGGEKMLLGNLELRVPIVGRLQGALFLDVGEIIGGRPRAPIEKLRFTPGVGLRYGTPLGPIRLDVGYNPYNPIPGPLYRPTGDQLVLIDPLFQPDPLTFWDRVRFHFSVGQPF